MHHHDHSKLFSLRVHFQLRNQIEKILHANDLNFFFVALLNTSIWQLAMVMR